MMKFLKLLVILSLLLVFGECNKTEDPEYVYCIGCPISEWTGDYQGSGTYYTHASNETFENVEVIVTITNPYDSTLKIDVNAPGYISENFSKSKENNEHYFSTGSGSRTLDLSLSKNAENYKLTGTAKRNKFNNVDSLWYVEQSLTFQVYKSD